MVKFEVLNELTLRVHCTGNDTVYTKAGAFISGENIGGKNYQFEKVLLGPQGNPLAAIASQLLRRFTGENLPLMKVQAYGESITYYANNQQHVVPVKLQQGESISVESENILAFTSDCNYSVRFLGCGVISQKGLATSVLTGNGPNAMAAILVDGNPIVMDNTQNGATIEVDPDAMVAFIGSDPGFKLDLSWKNIIGQASGETYMFEWDQNKRAKVIVQPMERQSGINIGMDGGSSGQRAQRQQNQSLSGATDSIGDTLRQVGSMLGSGTGRRGGGLGGGGLGSLL